MGNEDSGCESRKKISRNHVLLVSADGKHAGQAAWLLTSGCQFRTFLKSDNVRNVQFV